MSDVLFPAKYFRETKAKMVVDSGMNDLVKKNNSTKDCSYILCREQICLNNKIPKGNDINSHI